MMRKVSLKMAALPALALAFGLAVSFPAKAETAETTAPAVQEKAAAEGEKAGGETKAKHERRGKGKKGKGFGIPSEEELGKLEGMNAEQVKAHMEEKRKAWQAMSDEEKKAARDKNRAAYDALSDEKKAELKARHEKLTQKWHQEQKAKFDSMTPEEQEAFKKKMRERVEERGGKWGDYKGKEGGEFKKRGEFRKGGDAAPAAPETTAPAAE
ncbi:MAG TPA: hypothetical protein PLX33_04220 [Alphaproteobacteria bacterium]|nr:hypothetical protein [Alphaproteobacteria bacterium]